MEKVQSSSGGERRRGPGRPKAGSEDKSARVLAEALDLFARVGYNGASLEDIARASDLSKAGLLHHYPSKDVLFAAVLEERDRRSVNTLSEVLGVEPSVPQSVIEEKLDPWMLLESWERVLEENVRNIAGTSLYVSLASSVTNRDHPAHRWFTDHLILFLSQFARTFERGKELGTVDPDAPSVQIARILAAVSDGLQFQFLAYITDEGKSGNEALELLHTDIASETKIVIRMIEDRWRIR